MCISLKNNNRYHPKLAQLLVSLQENCTLSPAPATQVSDPLSFWHENSKNRLLSACLFSHFTLRRPSPYPLPSLTPMVIPRGRSAAEPSHFRPGVAAPCSAATVGAAALARANLWGEARGREESGSPRGSLPSAPTAALNHCGPVVLSFLSILRLFYYND